ncbi:hypothetical protein [Kaarinaea lacus]
MKKAILGFFLILIIIIAGGVYYVFSNLDTIAKTAIEKYGSETTNTTVLVDKVKIRLAEGSATINGLTIANPDNFSLPNAFTLGEITADINLDKTTGELVAVDLINIEAPAVFYEINAERKGSLNVLKDNLGVGTSTPSDSNDTSSANTQNQPLQISIARFILKDAKLHVKVIPLNDKTYELTLPPLELTNLSGTPPQITKQLLSQLIDHAQKVIQKQGLDKELDALKAKAQERIDTEKAKLQKEADDRIKSEQDKATTKLKGLFGN